MIKIMGWVISVFTVFVYLGNIPFKDSLAEEKTGKKVFTFRLQSEPETLDWNRAHTPLETHLLVNLMEGLLKLDSNLQAQPALAKSWTLSADRKVYTFHIRPNVKWSDGNFLKAEDFVYSWKRLLTPSTAASYAYFLYDIQGAKDFNQGRINNFDQVGVKALDPLTLQVKLFKPVSYWPHMTTFWVTFPLRQEVVEKPGTRWETSENLVTLGPYLLAHHAFNSKFVLKANPNYYGKRGNVDEVVGLIVADDSTALSLYEAGSLDFLSDISTIDLKRLEGRADLKVFPYLKTVYLGFVVSKGIVADARVRQAIGKAIDKEQFAVVLKGGQQGAPSFLPVALRKLFGLEGITSGLPYAPVQARLELDALKLQSKHLIMTLPSFDKSLLVGQVLQGLFKQKLGLELELQPWDNKAYRTRLDQKVNPIFLASWSADYPDPDNFFSVFLSDSGNNRTAWKNAKFDQGVADARYTSSLSERTKHYQYIEKILLQEDTVIIPLYYEPNLALVKERVKKLELNHFNYLDLRAVQLN